jgi:hypothetical protein
MLNFLMLFRIVGAVFVLTWAAFANELSFANGSRAIRQRPTAEATTSSEYPAQPGPETSIDRARIALDPSGNRTTERRTELLDVSDIEIAIDSALPQDQEKKIIRVVDYSRVPIANGSVSFPLSGAMPPPATSADRAFL